MELKLGPVPTQSSLNIYLNSPATGKVDFRVVDMNGRVVILKKALDKQSPEWHNQINVSHISSGLYFLELFVGNERFTSKFVKMGR